VLTAVRIVRAKKADRRSVIMIVLLTFLIAVMILNLIVVVPKFQ
jgi:hypothetical protein